MYKFSQRSLDNLKGIHPKLVALLKESIKYSPVDFTITDGVRSSYQQHLLYQKGRTLAGDIVTHCDGITKKSNHQPRADGYGYAVDLYPFINGQVQVNADKQLAIIAQHIKAVASRMNLTIRWGGDWIALVDYPHFELIK